MITSVLGLCRSLSMLWYNKIIVRVCIGTVTMYTCVDASDSFPHVNFTTICEKTKKIDRM